MMRGAMPAWHGMASDYILCANPRGPGSGSGLEGLLEGCAAALCGLECGKEDSDAGAWDGMASGIRSPASLRQPSGPRLTESGLEGP